MCGGNCILSIFTASSSQPLSKDTISIIIKQMNSDLNNTLYIYTVLPVPTYVNSFQIIIIIKFYIIFIIICVYKIIMNNI